MSGSERRASGSISADYWPDRILRERVGMSIYPDTATMTMTPDSFRACMEIAKNAGKQEGLEEAAVRVENYREIDSIAHDIKVGNFPRKADLSVKFAAAIRAIKTTEQLRTATWYDTNEPDSLDERGPHD